MIYGKIIRSPLAHARIVSIDTSEAEKAPGFKGVIVHKQPGTEVLFQGDEVVGIAADTEERSYDIARLVRVRYEQLPHFANVEQAMAPDAPKVFAMGNTRDGNKKRGISTPASSRRRTSSSRPTPRTSSPTSASRRTAPCASGTATSSPPGCPHRASTRRRSSMPTA